MSPKKISLRESIMKFLFSSILFVQLICVFISNRFIFGDSAAAVSSERSFTPPQPNINVRPNEQIISKIPEKISLPNINVRDKFKFLLPHIDTLVDHAEFARDSYLTEAELLKSLRRTRSNVRIIQRILDPVGASYNIIQYADKNDDLKLVIAIPGSRNNKNMMQNSQNKLILDDVLNIKVHSGYRTVYRAIFEDFMREEKKILKTFGNKGKEDNLENQKMAVSVTGHSLGGAVSCMLAGALQTKGYTINHVTLFGTPKFTDSKGALQLVESLPIERIEHVRDPVSISPMGVPNPFSDNYSDLEVKALLLLEPLEMDKITTNIDTVIDNDGKIRDESINISKIVSNIISNPLSALSVFDWRGERILEQIQRHKVYAGSEAKKRTGVFSRMGDMPSLNWQWHSMIAYHGLLKVYQAEKEVCKYVYVYVYI